MRKLCPALALLVLALLVVACGDDEDDEPLTKSEYIAKADAICKKSNAEFNRLFETDFPTTEGGLPPFFDKATTIRRRQIDDLRALEEPEADEDVTEKLLGSGDRFVADLERGRKDAKFAARIFNQEGGKNSAAFDRQAKAYGFNECGEDEDEDEDSKPPKRVDRSGFSAEKKAYIKRADAVCAPANSRFSVLEQRYLKRFPPPLKTWGEFLPEIVKEGRAQLAKLEAIPPPAADKAKIDELLDRQKALVSKFEEAGKTAAAGNEAEFQKQSRTMFADSDEIDADQRSYGFQACGAEDEEDED